VKPHPQHNRGPAQAPPAQMPSAVMAPWNASESRTIPFKG
jgi:hypothetical protein